MMNYKAKDSGGSSRARMKMNVPELIKVPKISPPWKKLIIKNQPVYQADQKKLYQADKKLYQTEKKINLESLEDTQVG